MKLKGFYIVLLRLVIAFIPLYVLYGYISDFMMPMDVAIAHRMINADYPVFFRYWGGLTTFLVSKMLSLAGVSNSYQGNYLTFNVDSAPFVTMIGWQCNFLLPFISYIAMVLAITKVTIKQRLMGLFGGLLLIYLGNIGRITAISLIGYRYGVAAMERYHMLIFDKGMALWTMLVFITWAVAIVGMDVLERCFEVSEE